MIVRRETDDITSFSEFRVRKLVVWNALEWLINNHKGYRGIVRIDSNNLEAMPADVSVQDLLTQIPLPLEQQESFDDVADIDSNNGTGQPAEFVDLIEHTAASSVPLQTIRQSLNRILNIEEENRTLPVCENSGEIPVLPFPVIDTVPINEFSTPGYIANAFPCLFPTGNYCFYFLIFLCLIINL